MSRKKQMNEHEHFTTPKKLVYIKVITSNIYIPNTVDTAKTSLRRAKETTDRE